MKQFIAVGFNCVFTSKAINSFREFIFKNVVCVSLEIANTIIIEKKLLIKDKIESERHKLFKYCKLGLVFS